MIFPSSCRLTVKYIDFVAEYRRTEKKSLTKRTPKLEEILVGTEQYFRPQCFLNEINCALGSIGTKKMVEQRSMLDHWFFPLLVNDLQRALFDNINAI